MDSGFQFGAVSSWADLDSAAQTFWGRQLEQISLPPMIADVAVRGVSLEDFEARDLAELVARDPVLAGKLLAVANSAKFGLINPITSVQRAIVHLGYNLVKTVLVAYELEGMFGRFSKVPPAHAVLVRRWSAGASVLAYSWAQAAQLSDASTIGTLTLLSRLGVLVLGLGQPVPDDDYFRLQYELDRLETEAATWHVCHPVLAGELARRWALPAPLPALLARQTEPLTQELPPGPESKWLSLCAASVAITHAQLGEVTHSHGSVLDAPQHEVLKANLVAGGLLDQLSIVLAHAKLQRELAAAMQE